MSALAALGAAAITAAKAPPKRRQKRGCDLGAPTSLTPMQRNAPALTDVRSARAHSRFSAQSPAAVFASKCSLTRLLDLYCRGLYCPGIGARSAKKPVTADSRSARLRSGERSLEVSTAKRLPGTRLASSSA